MCIKQRPRSENERGQIFQNMVLENLSFVVYVSEGA